MTRWPISTARSWPPSPRHRRDGAPSPSPAATCAAIATTCRRDGCSTRPPPSPGVASTAPISPSSPRLRSKSSPRSPLHSAATLGRRLSSSATSPSSPPTSITAATPRAPRRGRPRGEVARHADAPDGPTRFTEFDGNLAGQPVPSPVGDTVLSATRLERWARCGFRYFLARRTRLAGARRSRANRHGLGPSTGARWCTRHSNASSPR